MSETDDRLAIMDRLFYYAELIDSGRNDLVASEIFAPDGCVDMGMGRVVEGYKQLHPFFTTNPAFTKYPADLDGLRHDITNIRVRFHSSDVAESAARVTAWHWHNTHRDEGLSRPADLVVTGIYHDDWRRIEGLWRISRRRGGQSGTGIGIGAPAESWAPLFHGLINRRPVWGGGWVETPFAEINNG